MHRFEKMARQRFEDQAKYAAEAIGCDVSHVISIAAEQMRILAEGVKKGKADDASDIRAARGIIPAAKHLCPDCGSEFEPGTHTEAACMTASSWKRR